MSAPPALSPDQSFCSSDTGDVLIRSTRVLHPDRTGPGGGPGPGSVQITVRKLRDFPPPPPPLTELRQNKQRRRSPRQNPDIAAPHRSAAYLKPRKTTGGGDRKLAEAMDTGDDVLTSRFASGGRGVVLAALKQRYHSAPRRREVRVHFLDPMPLHSVGNLPDAPALSSRDAAKDAGVQMETPLSSGDLGDASSTAAAAAAAALAAAAPLFKAQSDMEARVAQLADGIQKLLQADREGGDRGRSMSQQTLQHLEKLQCQQVQLQSQLLESALRIASGHASDPPTHLPVTHLDAAAANSAQPPSSSPNVALPAAPVTMETHRLDRWTDQTRHAHMPERSQLQSLANHSWEAARRANDVLQEMKRLKTEMKMLLTQPEDPLKTSRPAPKHQQSQQTQTQSQQTQSQQTQSQPTQSQQTQSQQTQPQQTQSQQTQSQPTQSQQTQSQQTTSKENHLRSQSSHLQQNLSHENSLQSQQNQSRLLQPHKTTDEEHNLWSQQSQSVLVQRRSAVPSLLEEAGQVLRQVRKQKKVLEENLEALLRARTGEVLHCQLEALAANRDHSEEVRIKKTVDAWISRLSRDIQAEMSSGNISNHHSAVDADSSAHSGKERPVGALRGTGSTRTERRGSRGQRAGIRAGVEPNRATGGAAERHQLDVDGESYLTRVYGRAPYEGLRRTLKKSPYLRLSSPASPLGRKPRPRLVESVRGVKLKSSKTQTSLAPPLTQPQPIISAPPFASSSPGRSHVFSSSHLTSGHLDDLSMTPANSCPVAIAIPLGPPRMDSRCEHPQEVTSALAAPPTASVGDEAPDQQHLEAEEAPPPPRPPSHMIDIIEGNEEEVEEDDVFPGTDFLSVIDVVQEVSVSGEEAVELDGGPSPPPVLYQGPVFPPQAPSDLPAQDQVPVLGTALQRDVLESRLVEWVEQQLMSRMISELYRPPPSDPAQNSDVDQSDPEERSTTSDIVEAAGDAGLQLFVDASAPVDSELIRQLVNEVLAETIALMLGQRDPLGAGPDPALEPAGPAAPQENEPLPLVPTPEPTPPPSPAPPSRETTAVTTPPPSEPTSPLNMEPPQPIAPPGLLVTSELVATPTLSPEPTPSAESPATVHQAPPPFTWEETELPLDEERLVEDITTHKPPLLMSVAEEEPPLSSPHPPPPSLPPARSPSPPPEAGPASPSTSSEESSSSSTVTAGTEAALKHISEGELLISANQLAAMTGGGAVCSFNSSLQELQDMDFDPPSEGQVKGRELLRALLTKMEQGVTQRGEKPQPEGSWGRADGKVSSTHSSQSSSPGQISQAADVSEVSFEATNQGLFTLGDLTGELIGTLTSDLDTELSLSPPPHLENTHTPGQVLLVRKSDSHTARQQEEEGGSRKMGVHLPAVRPPEEEVVMEASVSAAEDSDSSTSNVF
ncbi:protein TALPID3 isoform X3 [Pelmatolapia mariae]|uniref:protein TALPID3 isoform X3 n=1 Tax=Pelmatolapia mariae TaxID=158779 RepID=UPI002FE66D30